VYERDYATARYAADRSIGIAYSFWNGEHWGLFSKTAAGAQAAKDCKSSHPFLPWRGLTQNPNT
jgi:hypothetical protein